MTIFYSIRKIILDKNFIGFKIDSELTVEQGFNDIRPQYLIRL